MSNELMIKKLTIDREVSEMVEKKTFRTIKRYKAIYRVFSRSGFSLGRLLR